MKSKSYSEVQPTFAMHQTEREVAKKPKKCYKCFTRTEPGGLNEPPRGL